MRFSRQVVVRWVAILVMTALGPADGGQTVTLNDREFHVHDGFELSVAARGPLTERPITACFDDEGRLYVAESSGSNEPVQVQLEKRPHSILRLEDTDGDGRFDRRVVFAERLMFPEGSLWRDGSLYVAAPPQILKFTDTDDDGRADQREVWFDGQTLTGCANDLHGPCCGPDGRIYWCKGAFAEQTYQQPDGRDWVTKASHIFRAQPDATGIEPVMTGGMDNPVDVAFSDGGERFFTTTFLQHPAGGRRDGIIHAIYGGVYGKDHSVLDGHVRTGDLMPPLIHLGAAAPSGLDAIRVSRLFGRNPAPAPDVALVAAQFNKHCISLHLLTEHGATYRAGEENLFTCSHPDFHPTDVFQDADGSLLIVDTGGWYKLCCPTSQLMKPDVPGAIYRLRSTRPLSEDDPRGRKLKWANTAVTELAARLSDPRPAVVTRSRRVLAAHGDGAVEAVINVMRQQAPAAQTAAVWTLVRIGTSRARAGIREALEVGAPVARRAAAHGAGLLRDPLALPQLAGALTADDQHLARAAAEAIGRLGSKQAVPQLLGAAIGPLDRVLRHSITYALIELDEPDATRAGLASAVPAVQCVALLALDQMEHGQLQPADVVSRLDSADLELADAARWIALRRPEWSGALSDWVVARLRLARPADGGFLDKAMLREFAGTLPGQQAMCQVLADAGMPAESRRVASEVLSTLRRDEFSPATRQSLAALARMRDAWLRSRLPAVLAASLDTRQPDQATVEVLQGLAVDGSLPSESRLIAASAVVPLQDPPGSELFDFLAGFVRADLDVALRTRAAGALAAAPLSREQRIAVTRLFRTAGLPEAPSLLSVFRNQHDPAIGRALVAELQTSAALDGIHPGDLREVLAGFPDSVRTAAGPLLTRLRDDFESRQTLLAELEQSLPPGDVRRGQAVFLSARAGCYSCHEIGYLGGTIGPDLTHVGKVRTRRDLLEAIVLPSASLVRSYEPSTVVTTAGQTVSGLVRYDSSGVLTVVIDPTRTVTLESSEVEEISPSRVSIMPRGIDKMLSRQELADLVEFLATRK